MYVFVYVCTQVDVLNENDKDAAAIDQSVPIPSAFPESDIVNNVVAKESPSERPKLEIHAGDIVPEVSSMIGSADIASSGTAPSKPKTYRSMYYKLGLCLKSCAYIC